MPSKCGTWSAYTLGCRCDECRGAAAAYQRNLREVHRANITGDEGWHGTVGGYTNHKCRCTPCRDAMNAYGRAWGERNREKINEQARLRRAKNPEVQRNASRRYDELHPERRREQGRRYRQANAAKILDKNARRRARLHGLSIIPFTQEQFKQRWDYFGGRCYLCGDVADTTDHVKPIAAGGAHILANLRPACRRCNARKNSRWPYAPVGLPPSGVAQ